MTDLAAPRPPPPPPPDYVPAPLPPKPPGPSPFPQPPRPPRPREDIGARIATSGKGYIVTFFLPFLASDNSSTDGLIKSKALIAAGISHAAAMRAEQLTEILTEARVEKLCQQAVETGKAVPSANAFYLQHRDDKLKALGHR